MRTILCCFICVLMVLSCSDDPIREHAIISFSPMSEGPGNEVRITGVGFGKELQDVTIAFNGTLSSVLSVSDTLLITEVPRGASTGPIQVAISGLQSSSSTDFVVLSGLWSQKSDIPSEVGFGAAVSFVSGGTGYVGTGGDNGRILDNFRAYEPETDRWSILPSIPGGPRRFCSAFVIKHRAYIVLGVKDNETEITREFYSLDLLSGRWNRLRDFTGNLPVFRDTYATFVIGNTGYLVLEKEIRSYNPEIDEWAQEDLYPGMGSSNHISEVIDGLAYIGLGFNDAFDWWSYDPQEKEWKSLKTFPGEWTWGLQSFQIQGKIYVVGKQCWAYDPNTDQWSQMTSHPDGRRFAIGFMLNDKGYFGAGMSIENRSPLFQKDFWEFEPE